MSSTGFYFDPKLDSVCGHDEFVKEEGFTPVFHLSILHKHLFSPKNLRFG
jgi:hypothetical protein